MENFKLYSQYYDLLYNDKNYEAEVIYLNKQIKQFKKDSIKILELGCGSGSHAFYLTKNGYKVTGVELSKAMYKIALKKKIINFELVNANIIDYKSSFKYDVVISMFHVISYINNNNDILKCFKNTSNNLKKGGLFLFDIWFLPAVLTIKPISKVKKISNDFLSIIRVADSVINYKQNIVNVNFSIFIKDKINHKHISFEEIHFMRYFSLPEIELFAALSGFKILTCKEMGTENEPNEKTWGVLFILQKI